jgi:hypothetical protein
MSATGAGLGATAAGGKTAGGLMGMLGNILSPTAGPNAGADRGMMSSIMGWMKNKDNWKGLLKNVGSFAEGAGAALGSGNQGHQTVSVTYPTYRGGPQPSWMPGLNQYLAIMGSRGQQPIPLD